MVVNLLVLGGALAALGLLHQAACLYANYAKARRSGVPVILSPFFIYNPLWILTQAWLSPRAWFIPLVRLLPPCLSDFSRVSTMDWPLEHGRALHRRLGPAFFIVSPGSITLSCDDTVANEEFLSKYKVWTKMAEMNAPMNAFGDNVVGVDGEEWARHKRIVGPSFNERTSGGVWLEAARQTQAMLDRALQDDRQEHRTLCDDSRTIALHTFMAIGFGAPQDFRTGAREKGPGHELSFREALVTVLHHLLLTLVMSQMSPAVVRFLPKSLQHRKTAFVETRKYFDELLEQQEKAMAAAPAPGGAQAEQRTFLTTLLRNARDDTEEKEAAPGRATGLSRSELTGNMFILTFAGHDTTATTIGIAVAQLAVHPTYQAWIREEVDAVAAAAAAGAVDKDDYKHLFPKLKRCQALMFETLRLFHPTLMVPRYAARGGAATLSSGFPLQVPQGTMINTNLYATYVSEDIWGADCATWKPDRFIVPAGADKPGWPEYRPEPEGRTAEKLVAPPLAVSSFWSLGPRVCLGIKFSQVEFVSVMFTLFSQATVEPVPRPALAAAYPPAEALQRARGELEAVVRSSGFGATGPLLHVLEPEKIVLRWQKR